MNTIADDNSEFEFDEKFTARALEMLDAAQALEFAEALRLGGSLSNVHTREYARLERKYGKEHPRTQEMALRLQANDLAKKNLFTHYVAASTPQPDAGEGWAVDGFVRTSAGAPAASITVAAYDQQNHWHKELGYGCTNERGYFSISVARLSEKTPTVYLKPSKGKKLLPANEVLLTPKPKTADRVEIILIDEGNTGDCVPPSGRNETRPPNESPADKITPTAPATKEPVTGEVPGRPGAAPPKSTTPAPTTDEPTTRPTTVPTAKAPAPTSEPKVAPSPHSPADDKGPKLKSTEGGARKTAKKGNRKA